MFSKFNLDAAEVKYGLLSLAISAAIIAGGIVMLLPVNSSQAAPRLENISAPATPARPPLSYRDLQERNGDRDWSDCAADSPRLYVTVVEGDRDAMLRIIRHSVRRHGGQATFFDNRNILCVRNAGSWEAALEALNPYVIRDTQQITAGYEVWARNEVIDSPPPATGDSGDRLHDAIVIRVDEDFQGRLSDMEVRVLGALLLIFGVVSMVYCACLIYDTRRV